MVHMKKNKFVLTLNHCVQEQTTCITKDVVFNFMCCCCSNMYGYEYIRCIQFFLSFLWICIVDEDEWRRKWRKMIKMKFSTNFWVWSLCDFCFFIFVPLILWLSVWNNTSTSSSVCHIDVFVTNDDGSDENQNVFNLQGLF
jgi:hypothetical protein